jgi:hypothetical protein
MEHNIIFKITGNPMMQKEQFRFIKHIFELHKKSTAYRILAN